MIEFTIDKKSYKIDGITIRQYYRIQKLLVSNGLDAQIQIVSDLSACPIEELRKLDSYQFKKLWEEVYKNVLDIDRVQPLAKEVEVNGKTYYFIDIKKLTVGEMADMDILKSDPNAERLLHKMMAILYRPPRRKLLKNEAAPYNSYDLEERAEEMLDLKLTYVFGAIHFFLQIPRYLLSSTLSSLEKEMKTESPQIAEMLKEVSHLISELQEVGSKLSPSSLETTLQKLKKSSEAMLSQHSTGFLTEKTKQGRWKRLKEKLSLKSKIKGKKWL